MNQLTKEIFERQPVIAAETSTYLASDLWKRDIKELPTLWEPLIPKCGLVALAGSSDTGKSSFLRQLAVELVKQQDNFLGFPFHPTHGRAIYVCSEDEADSIAFLLKKQYPELSKEKIDLLNQLRFIFETENLLNKLSVLLEEEPVDLIVMDVFSDIFSGDMNMASSVRPFLNQYKELAQRFECAIILLHHTGKKTQNHAPSKDNLLGSQGFEAKMRMVIELRRDFEQEGIRHLCIVKGNYLPDNMKTHSTVLQFTEELKFENTGNRVAFDKLGKPDDKDGDREFREAAIEMRKTQGLSVKEITRRLNEMGCTKKKSTVGNWIKGITPESINAADKHYHGNSSVEAADNTKSED